VREALLGGFAYSRILENHGQRMLERNFKPGFKAWMHQKDCASSWARRTASAGAALGGGHGAALQRHVGCGMGEDDSVAMLKLLERMSGGLGE
jgi:3-hydroxyisobutyrate dehydrogenase-like beta-hydroxyacid dehydrogenase